MSSTQKEGNSPIHFIVWSLFALILLGLLAVPAAANGTAPDEVRVNITYNALTPDYDVLNFSSIQPALEAVAECGTVTVDAGTYEENLNVTRAVSLVTDEDAVVDAMGWGIGIFIDADDVSVEGFTVTNATTYGIASNLVDAVEICGNTVTVVSDETTIAAPAGIYLNGGADHVIAENTVIVASSLPTEAGIVAWNVENTEVSDNMVTVYAEYVAIALLDAGILEVHPFAPWDASVRQDEVSALEDEGDFKYVEPIGIVVNGTDVLVDENSIGVVATCLGEPGEDVSYDAYLLGIEASGESVEVTDNVIEIESEATDYSYGDGIAARGALALIEGNAITSTVIAEDAEPWGINLYDALKGRVLENEVTIVIFADYADDTYGILAEESGKAQILDNNVTYIAEIGGMDVSEADAAIEGVAVYDCYQSQVAGNDVEVAITVMAVNGLNLGSEDSSLSSTAGAAYADLTGEIVEGWAGATGIDVNESDEAWILENEIAVKVLLASADIAENVSVVEGGIWSTGLLIEDSYDAVASGNTIDAGFVTAAEGIGRGDNASVAYTSLFSEVSGVVLYDTEDTEVSENCITVENLQITITAALATGSEDGGVIFFLDEETAEDEMEMNAFAASLDEEGAYAAAIWENLNETALARTRTTAAAAGIYADTDGDTEILANTVDVVIDSMVMDIAMHEVSSADAMTSAVGLAQGFGIIGPDGYDASICGNTVTVESTGAIEAESAEGEASAASVLSESQLRVAARGIVGLAEENDISDNTIDVAAIGESEALALEEVPDSLAIAASLIKTRAVGITIPLAAESYDNEVSDNTVNVLSTLTPVSEAEGVSGEVASIVQGRAAGIGIRAPNAWISGNEVDVIACVDNATAIAAEASIQEVISENIAIAIAQGIVTKKAVVEDNVVSAKGIATGTVVAETEELLENADALMLTGAAGIAIHDRGFSTMMRNTVTGDGEAALYGYLEGYRFDGFGIADAEGLGIMTNGGTVAYNNIESGLLGDYKKDTPTSAAYNWWGDASGPSGFGPGTGSPIYGVTYSDDPMTWEPWLTRPYETVLDEDKAYLGVELRPDTGLSKGWNTLSTPIALEDNSWRAISKMGEGLNYSIAYTWDAVGQRWVQVVDSTRISPLDAVYVKLREDARLPVAISPEITSPPVKYLKSGWNLIGPAYAFDQETLAWDEMKVDKALISIDETPAGLTGYTVVLSPSINDEAWVYTAGAAKTPKMSTGYGYWVQMENPDALAGFSSTPLNLPEIDLGWD